MDLLNRKEKENLVIQLAKEGKTIGEIAKTVHISLKDIGKIIHKATGDEDEILAEKEKQKENEKQKRFKSLSPYAKAFQMFRENKTLSEVVVELDLDTNTVLKYYEYFMRLVKMKGLITIYKELVNNNKWPLFFHLYKYIKKEGLNNLSITDLLENQYKIADLEKKVEFYNNHIRGQQAKIHQ